MEIGAVARKCGTLGRAQHTQTRRAKHCCCTTGPARPSSQGWCSWDRRQYSRMDVDVIPFKVPKVEGHQVYVTGLRWSGTVEDLEQELWRVFGSFGPIHRVTPKADHFRHGDDGDDAWYAYLTFFSTFDCEEAVQQSGKIMVAGNSVTCEEEQESCSFQRHVSVTPQLERDKDEDLKDSVRFVCLVRVRMPREGLCSEGLGLGEVPLNTKSPAGKGEALSCARRFAFYSAMKAAFSKFVIVRLRNGKVTAEVDTTQTDLQIYKTAWDNPLVEVIDIDHDPEENSDDEIAAIFEDMDEEDLDDLLDTTVNQDDV